MSCQKRLVEGQNVTSYKKGTNTWKLEYFMMGEFFPISMNILHFGMRILQFSMNISSKYESFSTVVLQILNRSMN